MPIKNLSTVTSLKKLGPLQTVRIIKAARNAFNSYVEFRQQQTPEARKRFAKRTAWATVFTLGAVGLWATQGDLENSELFSAIVYFIDTILK